MIQKNEYFFLVTLPKAILKTTVLYYFLFGKLLIYPWAIYGYLYILWYLDKWLEMGLKELVIILKIISEDYDLSNAFLYLLNRHFDQIVRLIWFLNNLFAVLSVKYFQLVPIAPIAEGEIVCFLLILIIMLWITKR